MYVYYVNITIYVYTYTHHCSPLHIRNVPYSTSIHSLVQSPCFFVESMSSTEHLTQRQPSAAPAIDLPKIGVSRVLHGPGSGISRLFQCACVWSIADPSVSSTSRNMAKKSSKNGSFNGFYMFTAEKIIELNGLNNFKWEIIQQTM